MPNADALFSAASALALAGWIALAAAPLRRGLAVAAARWLAALLCGGYATFLAHGLLFGDALPEQAGFGSLDAVAALFASREALLAGWVHYLAFDLFVGSWQVEDAPAARLPHALVLVCLLLTFVAGPAGLLAYLLLRAAWARRRLPPAARVSRPT